MRLSPAHSDQYLALGQLVGLSLASLLAERSSDAAATSPNSTNHDTRIIMTNNCAHSISLAAKHNESLIGGSLNGVVCAHVIGTLHGGIESEP